MSDLSLSKFGIKQSPSFKLDLMLSPSVKNSLKGFQDKLQDQIDEVKHSPSVSNFTKQAKQAASVLGKETQKAFSSYYDTDTQEATSENSSEDSLSLEEERAR